MRRHDARRLIRPILNGALVSNIALDISEAATDTIDYVATDPTGLTATSSRTVIVSGAAPDSPVSTTPPTTATSSAQ
jgi:hypothetical protein